MMLEDDFLSTPEATSTQQLIQEVDSNMDGKINFGLEAINDGPQQRYLVGVNKGKN